MKHWLFCLLLAALLWILPSAAQAEVIAPEILRLQVIANSNEAEDQMLKLQVRDAVLREAQEIFAEATSAERACELARQNQLRLTHIARQIVSKAGMAWDVNVEIGEFYFQDRICNGVMVPSGSYRTLRITLGAGEGRNWWCVLYPSLCGIDFETPVGDNAITFYSSTLRFLEKLFGGDFA